MQSRKQIKRNISAHINAFLERHEWTQGDMARALVKDGGALHPARMKVSRYVRGESAPPPATLAQIARIMGVFVEDLKAKPEPKKPAKKRKS